MTAADQLREARKGNTAILGDIKTHLMGRLPGDRRQDCIHPSEMSKPDWCPRQTYYRLVGVDPDDRIDPKSINLEMAWEDGHGIHRKWQNWLWEMGRLGGRWYCVVCKKYWIAWSPTMCPRCGIDREGIRYAEVPLSNDEYLIAGHSDGDLGDGLLEVKSIGKGTLRFDAPYLLKKYDDNPEEVWRSIRRPFPSHLRQGMLYLFLHRYYKRMVFVYDFKAIPKEPKEFVVRYQHHMIEDLLDVCLDIKYAVKKHKPLPRPDWASKKHPTCRQCPFMFTCYGVNNVEEDGERLSGAGGRRRRGRSSSEEGRPAASEEAQDRHPSGAGEVERAGGRRSDAAVHPPYTMGRLLERAVGRR